MGGEIGDDVEPLLLAENTFKNGIREVERVASELVGDEELVRTANVAYELREAVLIEIDYHDALRLKTKNCLDEAGSDRSSTSYDADFLAFNLFRQLLLVCLNVRSEHASRTLRYARGDEFV